MSAFRNVLLKRAIDKEKQAQWISDIFQAGTMQELLSRATDHAVNLFQCSICVLWLIEDDCISLKSTSGINIKAIKNRKIPIGQSFSGRLVKAGKPKLISNVSDYFKTIPDNVEFYYCGSILSMPLKFNNIILGLLNLCRLHPMKHFSQEDLNKLEDYAAQISFAIRSQRLIDEQTAQLKKYQFMVESAHDAIFYKDMQGRYVIANDKTLEAFGLPREKVIGKSDYQLMPDTEEARRNIKYEQIVLKKGKAQEVTRRMTAADGTIRWFQVIKVPQFNDEGNVIGLVGIARDITDLKKTEEALRESEEKYRTLFEESLNVNILLNLNGKIVDVNKACANFMGIPKQQGIGKSVFDFISPEQKEFVKKLFEKEVAGEYTPAVVIDVMTRRGVRKLFLEEGAGRIYKEGKLTEILLSGSDVTELIKTQEELRESRERFKGLAELLPETVFEMDENDTLTFVNRNAFEVFGYTRDEFEKGINLVDLLIPEDRERVNRSIKKILSGKKLAPMQFTALKKNGETFPIQVYFSSPICDKGFHCIRGLIIDISERQKMEAKLKLLSTTVEQSVNIVAVADTNGIIQYVNRAFEEITGYKRQEIIGHKRDILEGCKIDENLHKEIWETIKSGNTWTGRLMSKKKSGSVYTEDTALFPVVGSDGKITNFTRIGRDITDRVKLENQLQQAQKMESIGRLAGGVAHDLNNIMTGIRGCAELARLELESYEIDTENIDDICKAVDGAASLISQLLAFSRKQMANPQVLNINNVIKEMEKMIPRVIREDIKFSTSLDPDILSVRMDPHQLQQIIMNLVVNAKDAMPDGGKLIIETKMADVDESFQKRYPFFVPGSYVMLIVSDTGTGMDEETISHIFEPFFTTKEKGKGTGLGLSTVYGIVKQAKGHILVYSEPGQGTAFKIYLPSIKEKAVLKEKDQRFRTHILGGKEFILVVEDEAIVSKLVWKILNKAGYQAFTASSGEQALDYFEKMGKNIDMLITDMVLPDIKGGDLALKLMQKNPSLKVLFMSGYSEDVIDSRELMGGKFEFISKPFNTREFLKKVRKVLDK